MTTARTVLPTDLVALVSYDGRVYANEAMTADRTGSEASPHPLETAFEQWFSFATGRHTWISVKGATLRGLVSARERGSKLAWEVDCLIDAAVDDSSVLMSLLDQMAAAAGRSHALRIFLRLPADSFGERIAMRCGFAPYRRERLYRRDVLPEQKSEPTPGLRRREKADLYALFQLYNAAVPESERRIEAMTLNEWKALQEHLGRTSHYVMERDARIAGWLRVAADGDIGRFDLLSDGAAAEALVDAALVKLANRASMWTLVPDWQEDVRRALEARGFSAEQEYSVLCRRTVHLVKAAKPKKAAVPVPTMSGVLSTRTGS
jgi:hypothetical protein